jgi:S1-C subfamily serine protease
MKRLRKSLALLTLAGGSAAAGVLGIDLFQNVQFAQAQQRVDVTRQQLATVQGLSDVFREVGKAVEPSVVNIQVTKTVAQLATPMPRMFERFFHEFGDDGHFDLPQQFFGDGNQSFKQIGTGSGVIMDASNGVGYILTNNHVAGNASEMDVTLADGREIKDAKLVGADPKTDLAVVEIKADHLVSAKWGDSGELEPGDRILAFGSPFGYVGSMTHGIVSALDRQAGILGSDGYENFIQVDAPRRVAAAGPGRTAAVRGWTLGCCC